MDTDALRDCCLAVPRRHSCPGVPGRAQPLYPQAYWDAHIAFGHFISLLPLLLVIMAYLGRLPSQAKRLAWLVLGITLIQTEVFAAIRDAVPFLAAFHPVLALVLFALALIIALRARTAARTPAAITSAAEHHAAL